MFYTVAMDITTQPEKIRELLRSAKTIAVVGASPNPDRDSHEIAKYLLSVGYAMIPINPGQTEILGQKCYPDLKSVPVPIDIVDIFRRPEHAPPIVDDAIAIRAKCVWFQLDTTHHEAATKADKAGLYVLRDSCIKVLHGRLMR